jgi:hypothetical protein
MNIQEFSHQLVREEQPSNPSKLFRALRELRGLDGEHLHRSWRIGRGWGVWDDLKPLARAASER